MLCTHCRRLALAAVARQTRLAAAPRQLRRTTRLSSTNQVGAWLNSNIRNIAAPAFTTSWYSTSSPESPASSSPPIPPADPDSSTNPPAGAGPEKPDYLDPAETEIWDKLVAEFSPTELMVQDISGGCGSMYGIEIASEKFRGVNMLKQQRMVNAVLGDQMKGWHGVQLRTKVPS